VGNPTLNRFYTLHFLIPFIIIVLVVVHLFFLHETGSSNSLGVSSDLDKIYFHPYYSLKDLIRFLLVIFALFFVRLQIPFALGDPENFIIANSLRTPPHIQPEWYLLFAYSILRAIPRKLGGVIALAISIIILFRISLLIKNEVNTKKFIPLGKFYFWVFRFIIMALT